MKKDKILLKLIAKSKKCPNPNTMWSIQTRFVNEYGADSLRLYEMFLGPLEQYKPWNTAGITGVHSFLKKLWKLYIGENGFESN